MKSAGDSDLREVVTDRIRTPRLIDRRKFGDARGWFCETWNARRLAEEHGITVAFVQDNLSWSAKRGTVRGLHFQAPPHSQVKLVAVVKGRILDVAVDIRRGSPTYGRSVAIELSAENGRQLYVPAGFAHGFCTLEDDVHVAYKVSDFHAPVSGGGLRFDDLAIAWPVPREAVCLSDKDTRYPALADLKSPFVYDGVPLAPLAPA
ncbi:dTDP-4-dehydrorhamnose 3,5-epimerase [Rhodoplanes serenus]|uniref:dTDP-4-dehydrorhamnose 3,5-epimerase n=1 Tax=Rhodoplanes serenus TaxID=200615 RepID=A0A9X5ASC2_9BRAD|nr:dTDP-4-dehydrorhamnose 3,5-epimerase [Rhodoplanes serenus]MTW17282.1 dTDP-4-dehydrorhamnose 3,5-epimerase [Rhodoplanes serenus]